MKKIKSIIIKDWNFYLPFIFPFILFSPVFFGLRYYPFDFEGYNLPLIDSFYKEILNPESFLWDQYTYGGIALTSNPQAGLFYVPNLILIFLHYVFRADHISSYWYNILGIFQYSFFALFSSFLIFEITKSKLISFIGSIKIVTLGVVLANIQHPGSTGSYIFYR